MTGEREKLKPWYFLATAQLTNHSMNPHFHLNWPLLESCGEKGFLKPFDHLWPWLLAAAEFSVSGPLYYDQLRNIHTYMVSCIMPSK